MLTVVQVLRTVEGLSRAELDEWVSRHWITPARRDPEVLFAEIDVARIRLIKELHGDLAVDADAMPVLLSLIDRMYGLRRQLRVLCAAIEEQPEPVRRDILDRLRREGGE
jgi:chaperone modulatory protein CbpM